jgi:hypothetical protein
MVLMINTRIRCEPDSAMDFGLSRTTAASPVRGCGNIRIWPLLLWVLAVSMACANDDAFAEVFRWVDEQGRVHYGDRQPASSSTKSERVKVPAPKAAKSSALANNERARRLKQRRLLKSFEKDRHERTEKAAKAKADAAEKARFCSALHRRLAQAEQARYLFRRQGKGKNKGEEAILSHEDRAAYTAKLKRAVTKCG